MPEKILPRVATHGFKNDPFPVDVNPQRYGNFLSDVLEFSPEKIQSTTLHMRLFKPDYRVVGKGPQAAGEIALGKMVPHPSGYSDPIPSSSEGGMQVNVYISEPFRAYTAALQKKTQEDRSPLASENIARFDARGASQARIEAVDDSEISRVFIHAVVASILVETMREADKTSYLDNLHRQINVYRERASRAAGEGLAFGGVALAEVIRVFGLRGNWFDIGSAVAAGAVGIIAGSRMSREADKVEEKYINDLKKSERKAKGETYPERIEEYSDMVKTC